MHTTKKYLVFWRNNGRYGSVELTKETRKAAFQAMSLQLIQIDMAGTEHYEVLGIRKV